MADTPLIAVKIVGALVAAEKIRQLTLASQDGSPLPSFEPGAHIDLHLANGLVRQYSLSNHGDGTGHYEIAVLRDANSRGGSAHVHDNLKLGDKLWISRPRNLFGLHNGPATSLLFAGGIGITPIMSMVRCLHVIGRPFALHYSLRSRTRGAFLKSLAVAPYAHRVCTYFDDEGSKIDFQKILSQSMPTAHIYACGPFPYIEAVMTAARDLGWDETRLHKESFAAEPKSDASDRSFQLEMITDGRVVDVPPGRRALDILLEHGYDVPMSCEQGVCGTCLTRVISGVPDHRDQYLTPEEKALNNQFTPCCSRALSSKLILDL